MRMRSVFAALLWNVTLAGWMAAPLGAQVAAPANAGYQTEQQRKGVAAGLGDPARD